MLPSFWQVPVCVPVSIWLSEQVTEQLLVAASPERMLLVTPASWYSHLTCGWHALSKVGVLEPEHAFPGPSHITLPEQDAYEVPCICCEPLQHHA